MLPTWVLDPWVLGPWVLHPWVQDTLILYERHWARPAVSLLHLSDGLPAQQPQAPALAPAAAAPSPPAGPLASRSLAQALHRLPLPAWAFSVAPGANADFEATRLRLTLSSPIHPDIEVDWDLPAGRLLAAGSHATLGDGATGDEGAAGPARAGEAAAHPTAQYECRQVWAAAADGTAIPLTGDNCGAR